MSINYMILYFSGENIEHYFVGNWALHPEW